MDFLKLHFPVLITICVLIIWFVPIRYILVWGTASAFLGIVMFVLYGWSWLLLFFFVYAALAFAIHWQKKNPLTITTLIKSEKTRRK